MTTVDPTIKTEGAGHGWTNRIVGHGTKRASEFKAHPHNWRKHPAKQKSAVKGSLDDLGWIDVVIENIRTGRLIDGHERIEEAEANGDAQVPYIQVDLSEAEEAQALLSLDATAALATSSHRNVEFLLEQVQSTNTNTMSFLTDLAKRSGLDFNQHDTGDGDEQIDKAAELAKKWKTKEDQTWQIGEHRIICGDSTRRETYERLMGAERAAVVYTDPPYGVSYASRGSGQTVANDELRDNQLVRKLLIPAFKQLMKYTRTTAGFYIFHASSTRRDFEFAMDSVGLEEKQYLIWIKETFVMGHSDYRWQHEPFFYAQKQGETASFYGDRRESTCWRISASKNDEGAVSIAQGLLISLGDDQLYLKPNPPKNQKVRHMRIKEGESILLNNDDNSSAWEIHRDAAADYLHPTQKPVGLAKRAIENSSLPGEIVVDCFLGGAATLLAAEKTGRKCRGIELDPKYIAVALERAATEFPGIAIKKLS